MLRFMVQHAIADVKRFVVLPKRRKVLSGPHCVEEQRRENLLRFGKAVLRMPVVILAFLLLRLKASSLRLHQQNKNKNSRAQSHCAFSLSFSYFGLVGFRGKRHPA